MDEIRNLIANNGDFAGNIYDIIFGIEKKLRKLTAEEILEMINFLSVYAFRGIDEFLPLHKEIAKQHFLLCANLVTSIFDTDLIEEILNYLGKEKLLSNYFLEGNFSEEKLK